MKSSQTILVVTAFIFGLGFSSNSSADTLEATIEKLCKKMEQCLLPEIEASDMPQAMTDQIIGQMNAQCTTMYNWKDVSVDSSKKRAAVACLDSIVAQSCDELMSDNLTLTKECEAYEKMSDE